MTSRVRNKDKLVKQNIDTTLEPTEADEEILHMAYLNGAISYQFMIDEKGYTTKRFRRFKKLKHIYLTLTASNCSLVKSTVEQHVIT